MADERSGPGLRKSDPRPEIAVGREGKWELEIRLRRHLNLLSSRLGGSLVSFCSVSAIVKLLVGAVRVGSMHFLKGGLTGGLAIEDSPPVGLWSSWRYRDPSQNALINFRSCRALRSRDHGRVL